MNNLSLLIQTQKTVFTFSDIKKITQIPTDAGVKSFLQRAKANQILHNPYKGVRTLANYDHYEFAHVLRPQSYISCETVLFQKGIFFQYYGNTISSVSDDSRKYTIDTKKIIYYKIKDTILHNPIGIKQRKHYRIATPERALCDYIYLNPRGTIDAPENINIIRLKQLLPFYPHKTGQYIYTLLGKNG